MSRSDSDWDDGTDEGDRNMWTLYATPHAPVATAHPTPDGNTKHVVRFEFWDLNDAQQFAEDIVNMIRWWKRG